MPPLPLYIYYSFGYSVILLLIYIIKKKRYYNFNYILMFFIFFLSSSLFLLFFNGFILRTYAYFTYPKYSAKVVGVYKDKLKTNTKSNRQDNYHIVYGAIYKLKVNNQDIEVNSSITTGSKPKIGEEIKVRYKNGYLVEETSNSYMFTIAIIFVLLVLFFILTNQVKRAFNNSILRRK